jgi:hypothetical protein
MNYQNIQTFYNYFISFYTYIINIEIIIMDLFTIKLKD